MLLDLLRTTRKMCEASASEALATMDMTPAQAAILVQIGRFGTATASDLARASRYDMGATSRLIQRFVGLGWVERLPDKHDRRACRVSLTPLGRDAASRVRDLLAMHWNAKLAEWNREDCVALISLLRKLEKALALSGPAEACR